MASDLVDGDYLGSYRRFIVDFLEKVNPDDQLPIKTAGHDVSEGEVVGEIIHMTLQYLNQQLCPPSLQCYIVKLVVEEIKATCRKQPESCGFRQEEKTYAPLQLMQAVVSKVNEICQRYLENSRLALLPPPPSTPMPLANAFAIRNNRRKMEDRHVILHDLNTIFNIKDDSIASYYAVFDGHAGYQAAVFCAAHLHQYLAESRHYPTDPERALRDAFLTADDILVEKTARQTSSSGTTAVCALILNRKLYVAWVGDSQAALSKRGVVTQLVNSHKPDRNDERERVEQMGGTVMHLGIWRVNGNLAVSRAIGDAQYKPFVTGDPEIRCITLDGDEDFLIIGSDGLWDCVTEKEAAALIYRDLCRNPYDYDSASQRLVEYAKSQGSDDNITVIVVYLVAPSKIASRSLHNGNPLLADVQLDNMEPDNRFLSNANGQYDVNSAFVKQTSANNGSPDLMDDEDPYGNYTGKPSNVKHRENGSGGVVEPADYDAEEDDEDLGPETDVDALDDVSETAPALADVSRQLFPEKQEPCELYESEERMDDETPLSPQATKTNQRALIPEADNVGDSEDSEDEWNYYRIDPNKEKEPAAGAAGFSPEPKPDNETREDVVAVVAAPGASSPIEHRAHFLGDEKNDEKYDEKKDEQERNESGDDDSCSEPDSEREIDHSNALIDNEISAERNYEPSPLAAREQQSEKEDPEKFEPEKESEEFVPEKQQQQQPEKEEQEAQKEHEDDMDFQLNPNAAEFVPVSPTPIIPTRMDLDVPIAGSPLKPTPVMDDIAIPSLREFENEVRNRPCEIDEKSSCTNGQLLDDIEECDGSEKAAPATPIFNLDESEVSSTKAEFGDESSFLTASEFQRTGISNLDGSFTDSYGGFDDSSVVDPMTKSYGPADFMALGNPVDLNAVHDLPDDDDALSDENETRQVAQEEEKMNLENIQASELSNESADLLYKEESSVDPFLTDSKPNFLDSSSRASSPCSSIHEARVEKAENVEKSADEALEVEKQDKEEEHSMDEVEVTSSSSQLVQDDANVTSKLLEMDLEDRGSQDCGFQKCSALDVDDPKFESEAASPVIEEQKFVAEEEKAASEAENLSTEEKMTSEEKLPTAGEIFAAENAKFWSEDAKIVSEEDKFGGLDNFATRDEFTTQGEQLATEVEKFALEADKFSHEAENFAHEADKFVPEAEKFAAEAKSFVAETEDAKFIDFRDEFAAKTESIPRNEPLYDFSASLGSHDNFAASPVPESLPTESPQLDDQVEKLAESLGDLQTADDEATASAQSAVPPEVPILLNPLDLHIENAQTPEDDVPVEDVPDYQVAKAPDSPVDLISPLVNNEQSKNPFESADFGSPISFGDPQPLQANLQEPEVQPEASELLPNVVDSQKEVEEEPREILSEIPEINSSLKLSESLQEFTGLEEQLAPENSPKVSNGLEPENSHEIPSEEEKALEPPLVASESVKPEELTAVEAVKEEEPAKEPLEEEKKVEIPILEPAVPTEPEKIEKEEIAVVEAPKVAAAVATAAAASAVAASALAATKSTKAKPASGKTAGKPSTTSKTPLNKSTPTSPTKPAVAARTSSLATAKKTTATTSATRPTKLETGKASSAASKPSSATKTTVSSSSTAASKTTGRPSVSSPRTKPATSTLSKPALSSSEKKPTSNGDATKSSLASGKTSAGAKPTSSKPLVKSSTTRATSSTTSATSTAGRARATATAVSSSVSKPLSKTSSSTVAATAQRPKTAPTAGSNNLTSKSRLSTSAGKAPITEKQIKESANKQISSSRTSTTTTTSKTSRTSVSSAFSSSTTTTARRTATSKATSTANNVATSGVPPPIRKPAPITRPGAGKTTSNPIAGSPTTNGKSHATKITATTKTKVVVQNGVCTGERESKIVTSTTNSQDEDVPKKDLSPVDAPPTDNQLIVAAD